MKINIGSADRKLRAFVVAPVLVLAGLLVGPAGWLAIVLYVLAGVMLATSAVSFCPLYALAGAAYRARTDGHARAGAQRFAVASRCERTGRW